ncbi:MAG TPA: hypothetical protein VKB31_09570 [Trueperaceae bacterium]|nr:hypothetical protein [Trueperaceae bacterium]
MSARPRQAARRRSRRGRARRSLAAALLLPAVLGALLAGCRQSVPDTTVPDPLSLAGATLTIAMSTVTPDEVIGQLDDVPHTSPDIDPGYLVFDPASVTLEVPVSSGVLSSAGALPTRLDLSGVHATLWLEDAPSGGPVPFALTGTPSAWSFLQSAPASSTYRPSAPLALTLTLTDPNALATFVDLLTTGGENTAQITFHAGSTDQVFQNGGTLQLAFASGSAVFGY